MSEIKYEGILGIPKLAAQFFAAFAVCGLMFAWAIGYPIGRVLGGSHESGKSLAQYNMLVALYAPLCAIPLYGNYLHYRLLQKSDALGEALKLGGYPRDKNPTSSQTEPVSSSVPASRTREPIGYRICAMAWGFLGALAGFGFWLKLIDKFRTRPATYTAGVAVVHLAIGLGGGVVSAWCFLGN